MISFENDYSAGAHPRIIQRLTETNMEPLSGYGTDVYCQNARRKIREATECPEAIVEFLVGGTQTNAVVIASMLQSYEGVVAAETGHVSAHEAGAIENTGHKVLTLPQHLGKIDAEPWRNGDPCGGKFQTVPDGCGSLGKGTGELGSDAVI